MSAGWDELFDHLLDERDALLAGILQALHAQLPVYRTRLTDVLDRQVALDVIQVLATARAGVAAVQGSEVADLGAMGAAWAYEGIPVDEMMRAWQVATDVVVDHIREFGRRVGIQDSQLLEFVRAAQAWSDIAMVTAARGHRRAEIGLAIAEEERRAAFVRGALFGTVPLSDLRVRAEACGLDPTAEYIAVRAQLGDPEKQRKLEQKLGFHDPTQRRRGLCAVVDGAIAGFLTEPPSVNIDGAVGVGPPRPLVRLAESYRLAARALVTVQACGRTGAHDIASLGLRAAVAMDSDIGDLLRKRYLDPIATGSVGTRRGNWSRPCAPTWPVTCTWNEPRRSCSCIRTPCGTGWVVSNVEFVA